MSERLEDMLAGGHPNSLGRTLEVVETVLADADRFGELFDCYVSEDPVVRLRTSNALKRIEAQRRDLLVPYLGRLINEVGSLDQASAQWTLAQLFGRLAADMDQDQRAGALRIMKRNLSSHDDWIVLNATIETLSDWAMADRGLMRWLKPHLERLSADRRKSVASRAAKKRRKLYP
ncbi:MAG: hypothetical protein OXF78_04780 [Rhodospirillales bacterium]|nr:hypothetical protein [Rhodospirillales bacterium]MYE19912.1 hypothetical protein [Rhodospirillales bacterium]